LEPGDFLAGEFENNCKCTYLISQYATTKIGIVGGSEMSYLRALAEGADRHGERDAGPLQGLEGELGMSTKFDV
jgi:hypothetical protein